MDGVRAGQSSGAQFRLQMGQDEIRYPPPKKNCAQSDLLIENIENILKMNAKTRLQKH